MTRVRKHEENDKAELAEACISLSLAGDAMLKIAKALESCADIAEAQRVIRAVAILYEIEL